LQLSARILLLLKDMQGAGYTNIIAMQIPKCSGLRFWEEASSVWYALLMPTSN